VPEHPRQAGWRRGLHQIETENQSAVAERAAAFAHRRARGAAHGVGRPHRNQRNTANPTGVLSRVIRDLILGGATELLPGYEAQTLV